MDIAVPSRFACLKIEDDDWRPAFDNADKRKNDTKLIKKINNKKGCATIATIAANKQSSSSSKKHKNKQVDKQWEEWKKIDSELINENFEQDMQNAILQSKLDYDAKKSLNGHLKTSEKTKQSSNNVSKKKKTKTMSLDQFLEGPEKNQTENEEVKVNNKDNEAFFEKLMEVAKQEVTKGRVEEKRREREINVGKIVTIAQYQEKLKIEHAHCADLQQQLDEAKAEIANVKARNKTLCGILGQGEMREKADILLELERVNIVKDELTEEVGRLHKLLEQERSKTTSTSDSQVSKYKEKKRKKNGC